MMIGQGGIQLSHMSIVNSISYDQNRRDMLLNYRNSCTYGAGIFIPLMSLWIFTHVEKNFDQFSYLANISCVLGTITSIAFALIINEPKLVKKSKDIYNTYFLI
jgi:Na+/melibiose symporter-like transporter